MSDAAKSDSPVAAGGSKMSWYNPRMFLGSDFFGYTRVLVRNRFRISPSKLPMALFTLLMSLGHTLLRGVQTLIYGRRVAACQLAQPPVFILGHWRCGTTLLHELLILDPRHTFPTTWECLAPNHFLLTGRWARLLSFLIPKQRPMDNMPLGLDRPQEDEFALCNLGLPSPYWTVAFPNEPPPYEEYYELATISPEARARWKQTLLTLLKQISLLRPQRIVLKSPPHTFRVKTLLEMFPEARFIYLVRDPYAVFPSTVHLWKSLYRENAMQVPTFNGLEEYVLATFAHMFETFEATRDLIPPGQLVELRYEELVRDPLGQMARIYETLSLGDFAAVRPAIEAYFAKQKDYQTNRYRLTDEQRAAVTARWGGYLRKYGYADVEASV